MPAGAFCGAVGIAAIRERGFVHQSDGRFSRGVISIEAVIGNTQRSFVAIAIGYGNGEVVRGEVTGILVCHEFIGTIGLDAQRALGCVERLRPTGLRIKSKQLAVDVGNGSGLVCTRHEVKCAVNRCTFRDLHRAFVGGYRYIILHGNRKVARFK